MANPYEFNNLWYPQPGQPMNPGMFGPPPLFGTGPSYTPYRPSFMGQFMDPSMDMMIQQMTTMGGMMMGGGGGNGYASNPFQPSGYSNFGFYAQDARMRQLGMAGAARSHTFNGLSGARGQALFDAMNMMAPGMIPQGVTGADVGKWLSGNDAGSQALLQTLGALGISPTMLNPELDFKMTSASLLNRYTSDPEVLGGFMDAFAAQSGYDPKKGRITDARKSQGWQVNERARFFDTLQSQGLVGINANGLTNRDSAQKIAESYLRQLGGEGGLDSAFATARSLFGTDDPNAIVRSIEAVTGGGIGRMDPNDVNAKLMSLKKLSETAKVSVEALVQFIESSVAIAESRGLSGAAAASNATNAIATVAGVNNSATASMAGIITPGLERRNERLLSDFSRVQMSALGSPMAIQGANAYVRLEAEAAARGTTVEALIGSAQGADKDILQSVLNLKSGNVGLNDINNVGRSEVLSGALSRTLGTDYGNTFRYITDKNLGQQALSMYTEFGTNTALANALEKGRRYTGSVNNALGANLTQDETVKLLALTAQYGMTTTGQNEGLAAAIAGIGGQEGSNIANALGGISDGKFTNINQAFKIAPYQNAISRVQALIYNDPERAEYARKVTAQGRIAADIASSIGGLPAIDAMLEAVKNGGSVSDKFAGALGFQTHNDIIESLVSANKGVNVIGKLSGYKSGSLEADTTIEELSRLATGDIDKQVELKKKLSGIIGGAGSTEAKDSAIRDALSAAKSAPLTDEEKAKAKESLDKMIKESKQPQGQRDVREALTEWSKPGGSLEVCIAKAVQSQVIKTADINSKMVPQQHAIT